jgi:hypothetical protein
MIYEANFIGIIFSIVFFFITITGHDEFGRVGNYLSGKQQDTG